MFFLEQDQGKLLFLMPLNARNTSYLTIIAHDKVGTMTDKYELFMRSKGLAISFRTVLDGQGRS